MLTAEAVEFLTDLDREFRDRRAELLARRVERLGRLAEGELPDFLPETEPVRAGEWRIAPFPDEIADRRVEITGPVDRKMVINALNSGARVFMADFEDATSPTWDELVHGQVNLRDYWLSRLSHTDPETLKHYKVGDNPAVLMVRPRGWHLPEDHVTVNGEVVAGALFDFALYLWHNARGALAKGSGPYFYLPKLESRHEAALWSDVFAFAEAKLRLERGTIKATVLIETCHRRGAFAMGGMAAQIPVKGDEAANAAALERVRADKLREAKNGHDDLRAAVERVDQHLRVGRPGDLHAAVLEVRRDRTDRPAALANVARLFRKVG